MPIICRVTLPSSDSAWKVKLVIDENDFTLRARNMRGDVQEGYIIAEPRMFV